MSENEKIEEAVVTGEDQNAQLQRQLESIVKTSYIYENIKILLAQSSFKGEVAQALMEIFQHCNGMRGNLQAQKSVLDQMLIPVAVPRPAPLKAVPGKKGKKR